MTSDTDIFTDVYVARAGSRLRRGPWEPTPTKVSLVPAYRCCEADRQPHPRPAGLGGGANDPSCNPPVQTSDHLTVGTPDSNALIVHSSGFASFTTCRRRTPARPPTRPT